MPADTIDRVNSPDAQTNCTPNNSTKNSNDDPIESITDYSFPQFVNYRSYSSEHSDGGENSDAGDHSAESESNWFSSISGMFIVLLSCVLFISIFYATATGKQTEAIIGSLSPQSVITSMSHLSIGSRIPDELENWNDHEKENIPPLQAARWYEGVVVRPVAFKAVSRRPSKK